MKFDMVCITVEYPMTDVFTAAPDYDEKWLQISVGFAQCDGELFAPSLVEEIFSFKSKVGVINCGSVRSLKVQIDEIPDKTIPGQNEKRQAISARYPVYLVGIKETF